MIVKNIYSRQELEILVSPCQNRAMEQVQKLRKLKGWNQTMLAEVAGVDQSTISKTENGWDGITLRNLRKVATALDVEVYQLLMDDGAAAEMKIIEAYRALPKDRQLGWQDMAVSAKADSRREDQ